MSILGRVRGAFEGMKKGWAGDPGAHLTEAVTHPFGIGGNVDRHGIHADRFFRAFSQGGSPRDLPTTKRERSIMIAYWLYLGYPLAFRGLSIYRDFIVGEDVSFKAKDPIVKEILKQHWEDPTNDWELWLEDLILELGLYGEIFLPVFVSRETGRVRLGYIDPLMVREVVMDPMNCRKPHTVILKEQIDGGSSMGSPWDHCAASKTRDRLRVVHLDENPMSKSFGRLVGDIFVFQVNKVSNATRGNSDLLSAIDWLDQHEQMLMTLVEMARVQMAHVWDMTVKGARGKQLAQYRKIFGERPKAGTVRIHNERVDIKAIAPDLNAGDVEKLGRMLKRHIAAALGLPEHWLGEGGDGLAAAAEMGVPTTKRLRGRQKRMRTMLIQVGRFVIDQFEIAQPLKSDLIQSRTISVQTPPIWPIDTQRITASLLTGAQALTMLQEAGAISPPEVRRHALFLMSQLDSGALALDDEEESFSPIDEINDETRAAGARARGMFGSQRDQLEQRQMAGIPEPEAGANL